MYRGKRITFFWFQIISTFFVRTKAFCGVRYLGVYFLALGMFFGASQVSYAKPQLDDNVPSAIYQVLAGFVERTYLSGYIHKQDLYHVYYAPRLKRYWNLYDVSRKTVIADKRRHFRRWKYTEYRLIDDTLEIYRIVGQRDAYAIRFDYNFYAERRSGKGSSGKGSTQLLIRIVKGTPVIYREVGNVLERY